MFLRALNCKKFDNIIFGKFLHWRILNLLIHSRRNNFEIHGQDSNLVEFEKLNDFYNFFASLRTTVSKDFYREIGDRLQKERIPTESFCIETKLGYVGEKSLSFVYSLLRHQNKEVAPIEERVLASATCQMVFVDKKSRKSAVLPEWWIEKYKGFSDPQKCLKLEKVEVPFSSLIFLHHFTVAWNDTDSFHHTHFNSYVNYCFEVANQAVHSGFFSDGFKCNGDILNRELKLIEILYLKESVAGDKLRASMWMDKSDNQVLRFLFEKGNRRGNGPIIICQAVLGFHD